MVDLAFASMVVVTVGAAVLALEARELVYGGVALAVSFLGVAGLFGMLGATYLAMFQITIYVGAVAVLILFTIMLVRRERAPEARPRAERTAALAAAACIVLIMSLLAFTALPVAQETQAEPPPVREIGATLMGTYSVALEILALTMASAIVGALTLAKVEEDGASQ